MRVRSSRPLTIRRAGTSAVASAALVAAALSGVAAADTPPEHADLGDASDYGVLASPADTVYDEGVLSGSPRVPSGYFVQLSAPPVVAGGSAATVAAEQEAFLAEVAEQGADLEVSTSYQSVWNGLALSATEADLSVLAATSQVEAIFPIYTVDLPEDQTGSMQPMMGSAIGMTGVDEAHAMGITGEGLKIAIIDTGVDVDHPDFGGGGTPTDGQHSQWRTAQIQYGIDLVGDDYNADPGSAAYSPTPVPDGNPDDCNGHGTHVAGIAAGNGDPDADGVVGVAPDAAIGAYRVFGCAGSTTAEIMLAAMEQSYEDGMDVVNMSIGSAFVTWKQYPTAVAADALVDAGVVVVASIGNSGAEGLYSAGAPGVGDKVIGVASYDNTQIVVNAVTISPDDAEIGYVNATGAAPTPTEGTTVLSRLGDPGSAEARACVPITADLTGTTVLVERGAHPDHPACDASFYNKALQGQEAGAEAVIIYNNVAGLINPTVEPPTPADPPITIPVIFIQQADGVLIDGRVVAGETTLTWTDQETTIPSPTGGLISSFSSYGMTAELGLKPDIGAPGGNIRSAWPLENGGYATISGTSMASPHVAGAVALLLQEHPDLSAAQVRDVLQNSADPALWSLNVATGLLEGAFRQGAGMLDVDDAILATTSITPGKLALGEGEAGPQTVSLSVTNTADAPATYDIANNAETIAVGPPTDVPSYYYDPASMTGPTEVTVGAGETAVVELTITPPASSQRMYSGWITFTPGEGDPLRVPYAGFSGDYQSLEVLTPGTSGALPVLGQLTACDRLIGDECAWNGVWDTFADTGAGDEPVYTLVDGDVPTVLAHLEHQARSVTLTAYEVNDDGSQGAEVGVVSTQDYLPRSAAQGDFSAFVWDGTFQGEAVADGKYLLEMSVLKALGDPANPAHTETFTSEPFTIGSAVSPPSSPEVTRYVGTDRYATAARISAEYEPGVDRVYIATGRDYPDALAGAALAGAEGAPLLLVRPGSIPAATQLELNRLDAGEIIVLGGTSVVDGKVASQLRDFTDGAVTRVSGTDRYATAATISQAYDAGVDMVYVATGADFPDALAGAARAGATEAPVLLVQTDRVPAATRAALDRLDPTRVVLLGGTTAISADVAIELADYGAVSRQAGVDRYATAAAISTDYDAGVSVAFVATGLDFPDALAGAARAGHVEAPVLLVKPGQIPAVTLAELERLEAAEVVILGGTGAVSKEVEEQIAALDYTG
ncbi:S8 family serine peptidase [Ornithinimicrobium ciconiae]|uniref:S8 family serine peptidase n=1 Tax=Ornithinimicrobium ciconiae TaxID=2594265 RepID=A0A516G8X9_9MICO|nr:S8 family serine peptidase [Ornithinimicrobium ciconiae]QDO87986.1 S8 family serine peptidase [Ornithinimicrobium ciconiae]